LRTGSNVINKGPEQRVGDIFKNRFVEAKNNLEEKIQKMTRSGFGLKRKRKPTKAQSQSKQKGEGYFHREDKGEVTECLKSGLDIFLKRSIRTSVVNSHTLAYKPIAPADSPTQLGSNCSGQSNYYIDLNCTRLLLRTIIVKLMDHIYRVLCQTWLCQ
jgi:hypothetical protein